MRHKPAGRVERLVDRVIAGVHTRSDIRGDCGFFRRTLIMLKTLVSPFKEFGFFSGLAYLIDQILLRVSENTRLQFYELMVQPIPEKRLVPERFIKSLCFQQILEGDEAVQLMPAREDIKEERFRQGAICLGAYKQEELIGFVWFAFGHYQEDEVRCNFILENAETSVFDFDFYLFPQHRAGLNFVGLWDGANRFLREKGIRQTYSRVTRFNTASRRAHVRLGAQCFGKVIVLKLGSFEWLFATQKPFLQVSFFSTSRVDLRMQSRLQEAELS